MHIIVIYIFINTIPIIYQFFINVIKSTNKKGKFRKQMVRKTITLLPSHLYELSNLIMTNGCYKIFLFYLPFPSFTIILQNIFNLVNLSFSGSIPPCNTCPNILRYKYLPVCFITITWQILFICFNELSNINTTQFLYIFRRCLFLAYFFLWLLKLFY